ncbi:hypothetical protein [Pseudonocardia abyssalis]|uniref:Uncharacterized protein n=1 Tax=Pseudonocardia abyssalis TaxID=2792008 RepID=A0ABS6UVK9_9PSEU|nr:hypothetical protein [Pseudonocardia abyssalis]MBW0117061.1 hypothetical protein [Pseudonocardia abyssalis]MBW0136001.1 hypothetical protein [Pseudonocardia abyssalis]
MSAFDDRFPPLELDRPVWTPAYPPAWSSRAATHRVGDEGLRPAIPDDHPVWCADPALHEEFSADRRGIDVAELHRYAIDRRPGGVDLLVDDEVVRRSTRSPGYPMLLIIGLFDFPDRAVPGTVEPPPERVVRRVVGAAPPDRYPVSDQPLARRTP